MILLICNHYVVHIEEDKYIINNRQHRSRGNDLKQIPKGIVVYLGVYESIDCIVLDRF
jgi:hypothetical protein